MNTNMLQKLLEQRVSRREFLAYIGAGLIAMTGIHAFMKSFMRTNTQRQTSSGYGGGVYGGKKHLG